MKVGKTIYVTNRTEWRSWLSKHHRTAKDIWLVYYKKGSNKKRIPYNDAVEEALCYGWIDSIAKPRNRESWVQRFSPRRRNSVLSEMNKERIRRLVRSKRMTRFGLASIQHHIDGSHSRIRDGSAMRKFNMPDDLLKALKADPVVWKNFQRFPASYKQIRLGWIDASRHRPAMFRVRLNYFLRMTAQNKKFGMVQ